MTVVELNAANGAYNLLTSLQVYRAQLALGHPITVPRSLDNMLPSLDGEIEQGYLDAVDAEIAIAQANFDNILHVSENWAFTPIQSGVDLIENWIHGGIITNDWSLHAGNLAIESLTDDAFGFLYGQVEYAFLKYGNTFNITFHNQALDLAGIDGILDEMAIFAGANPSATPTLYIDGGTNAQPTLAKVTILTGAGWTVNHN